MKFSVRDSVYSKIFFFTALLSLPVMAATDISVRKFIQKKYLNGKASTLSVSEDDRMKLYRVREITGNRGWTVVADKSGKVSEVDKSALVPFLKSLGPAFQSVKFQSKDNSEATKISNTLLNHLSTAQRTVECAPQGKLTLCGISFSEGELADQKAELLFDFQKNSIRIR
jgi:hypothetical protein